MQFVTSSGVSLQIGLSISIFGRRQCLNLEGLFWMLENPPKNFQLWPQTSEYRLIVDNFEIRGSTHAPCQLIAAIVPVSLSVVLCS